MNMIERLDRIIEEEEEEISKSHAESLTLGE